MGLQHRRGCVADDTVGHGGEWFEVSGHLRIDDVHIPATP